MSDPTPPAPAPLDTRGVLHLFLEVTAATDAEAVVAAVKRAEGDDHQVVTVGVLGHKADLCVMAVGPDLWRLRDLQGDLAAAGLELVGSYVSRTELSEYAANVPDRAKRERLRPTLPPEGKTAFCFYPMSKRRQAGQNWYRLPYEQRLELMYEHGRSGRNFAGRVVQLVTGSTGLDDWEWGVTLFAVTHDDLKEVVYTMRFDEASALYAEFGPFVTGVVAPVEELVDRLVRR